MTRLTDEEWLNECARHAYQSDNDRSAPPLGWMARAVEKRREAIAEFGQEAFDAAYARQAQAPWAVAEREAYEKAVKDYAARPVTD